MHPKKLSICAVKAVLAALFCPVIAAAGLTVTVVESPPKANVRVKQEKWDHTTEPEKRTSLRFFTDEARGDRLTSPFPTDPPPRTYYRRDRDLGQTFTMSPGRSFRLEGITLRTGPSPIAIGKGAPEAAVSFQFFTVSGTPATNDNGWCPTSLAERAAAFYNDCSCSSTFSQTLDRLDATWTT